MTRNICALVFLTRLALFAQPAPNSPAFSQADIKRLIDDTAKVLIVNTKSATGILARQYSEEMQKAAKAPTDKRAAAMQKATDDYRKRVDAFNQGGDPGRDLASAEAILLNPMHPENGFYGNSLLACMTSNKFLTRTEDGMPVLQQVTVEGGITVVHTSPPGLPLDKTAPSQRSLASLCPTLVQNAVRPSPKTIPGVPAPAR